MRRIRCKAPALAGLVLLAGIGPLAGLHGQGPPGKPAAGKLESAPQPGEGSVLREAVGALAGNLLYQTYLNIGFLADGKAEDLYSQEDAQKILTSVLALLDTLDRQLARVGKLELSKEDRDGLERIGKLAALLRRQGEALRAFWKSGEESAGERYEKIRQEAWEGISDLLQLEDKDEELVGLLREALKSKDAHLRLQAAQRLAKMGAGAAGAVPDLIEALQDRAAGVRTAAGAALVQVGAAAVPALIEHLKKDDATQRQIAAQVLGAMGPTAREAVPALVEALNDSQVLVRRNAAAALGQIGPDAQEAIPALKKCLKDSDLTLRKHAAAALQAIQGE